MAHRCLKLNQMLLFLYNECIYFLRKIKLAIIYFISLFLFFLLMLLLIEKPLTVVDLALFLSLNYTPTTIPEALAILTVLLMELSPIMAFVEVRTLSIEEKSVLLAKTYRDHIILVGCGHLGKRVASLLLELNIPFLIITLRTDLEKNEFINSLIKKKIPVIFGDASVKEVLLKAKIDRARAIIISVNNDLINYKISYKVKTLAPHVKVIARVYDDEMANILKTSGYADEVLSSTAISVLNYILGSFVDVVTEIDTPILIRITPKMLRSRSTLAEMEKELSVHILSVYRDGTWLHDRNLEIKVHDILCIQGPSKQLRRILQSVNSLQKIQT